MGLANRSLSLGMQWSVKAGLEEAAGLSAPFHAKTLSHAVGHAISTLSCADRRNQKQSSDAQRLQYQVLWDMPPSLFFLGPSVDVV